MLYYNTLKAYLHQNGNTLLRLHIIPLNVYNNIVNGLSGDGFLVYQQFSFSELTAEKFMTETHELHRYILNNLNNYPDVCKNNGGKLLLDSNIYNCLDLSFDLILDKLNINNINYKNKYFHSLFFPINDYGINNNFIMDYPNLINKYINIPIYIIFKQVQDSEDECIICLGTFVQDETAVMLKCMHKFHKNCLDEWIDINKNCPTCRSLVR